MGLAQTGNATRNFAMHKSICDVTLRSLFCNRYHDGGRLSDQQMALLQYQRENLHFMSEEVYGCQIYLATPFITSFPPLSLSNSQKFHGLIDH